MPTPRLWLDKSKYQARRLNPFTGNWDPANWDISRIDFDAISAEAEGVIIRLGDGLNLDPCYERFREELDTRGVLWGAYHLHRPNLSPEAQVAFILHNLPYLPPAGFWPDLEINAGYLGEAYYARTNPYLLELDEAYHLVVGMYSAAWFLDGTLSAAIQRRWAHRKGWWASYPALRIPQGWAVADIPYVLHQFTSAYTWLGLPSPADASWRNPTVPLEAFMTGTLPPSGEDIGTRIGIHLIRPDRCMDLIREVVGRGAHLASVLAVEQAGVLMEVAALSPATLRLLRLYTPGFDGLDNIHQWTPEELEMHVQSIWAHIRQRRDQLSVLELAAVQMYVVLNEADPIGTWGWRNYGVLCKRLCELAQAGGMRLVIPGWNNGTPEYREMVEYFSTGLAEALVAGRHALNIHEGVHPPNSTAPLAFDTTPLPGAPWPVQGAGSLAFRYRYAIDHLRRTGRPVPDIYVGEFYGGAYEPEHILTTLANFKSYDLEVRKDPWVKAFHGFTMDPDEGWRDQNYNGLMLSEAMLDYVVQERDKPNPTQPSPLPDVVIGGGMTQYLLTVVDALTTGDILERLGPVNVVDLRLIVPIGGQDQPPPYYADWPLGVLSPTRTLAAPNKVLDFYRRDGQPYLPYPLLDASGQPRAVTWAMQASEHVVVGGIHLLRVLDRTGDADDWYVRAGDVLPGG